jgi:hypothetical protein
VRIGDSHCGHAPGALSTPNARGIDVSLAFGVRAGEEPAALRLAPVTAADLGVAKAAAIPCGDLAEAPGPAGPALGPGAVGADRAELAEFHRRLTAGAAAAGAASHFFYEPVLRSLARLIESLGPPPAGRPLRDRGPGRTYTRPEGSVP